ncbi:DUF4402 domain-containing protein [Halomonas lysinitropha]|uniref:DUF4402 domain-containing protein n=1 Tax=Halomonas lysinitropha TaxID=2607506 RepID=A0A5K1I4R9_9GAMM|nr:DUF4402 domain-containing protein [Halomonas lysinitropha]VVZ94993.1 hypothetical protein HALO32_01057 [Halomonas lysinitropha]
MNHQWAAITAGALLATLVASHGWAQEIAIQNTRGLSFGSFVAGSGGSVAVSPSGLRSAGGDVLLLRSGEGFAAEFTVTGDTQATYTIQLPGDDFVTLTGPGSGMVINAFTSAPSGAGGQLSAGGTQTLTVGGALNVGSAQTPGVYAGTFSVILNYN